MEDLKILDLGEWLQRFGAKLEVEKHLIDEFINTTEKFMVLVRD